ncbi:MAG TPA: hypothetical protein ENI68_09950 [Gammaproteobacteria bacterium]|nr:hypothetical protein [Gammaproteobacteria bacterium]
MNNAAVDAALRFIPADDRETWVKVGMAIHAELGDDGYSLWDYWSQTGQSYNECDARQVWRSFKSGPVQIASLFHIAREHGYRPDRQAPVRQSIPQKAAPSPQNNNTKRYALEIWLRADCSDDAVSGHEYAISKGISHAGGAGRAVVSGRIVGQNADCLVIPIRNIETDKLVGLQCVNERGVKQTFGQVSGHGLLLGNTLDKNLHWFVAEGWASSYSMVFHHYGGNACCAASFGKGNLDTVAHKLAEAYAPREIVILRERDA